jgi:hypothetical protein
MVELRPTRHLGFQVLGVWLILYAIASTSTLFGLGLIMPIVALVAGLLILIGK